MTPSFAPKALQASECYDRPLAQGERLSSVPLCRLQPKWLRMMMMMMRMLIIMMMMMMTLYALTELSGASAGGGGGGWVGGFNNTCEHVARWGPIAATNATHTTTHNNVKTPSLHNSSWYCVYPMEQCVQTKHNQLLRNRYTRNNWVHE